MEKYENIGVVGEGSYGLVMKCRHRETGQLVAIKKFIETEEDATVRMMALREIRMLKKLRHENLVNMIEVFRRKKRFYLVFEYVDHTILDELEAADGGLGEDKCREHVFQILRAVDFCHQNHIVHRDVKPENVLVSSSGVIKLCDFGFARTLSANGEIYTDYVATRWYRAPELLVGDAKYGKEVDVWAVGCLFAEMMAGDPLFPGDSDIDQLFQITKIMGKLSAKHQHLVARNPAFKGLKKPSDDGGKPLNKVFPSWSTLALDFLGCCLKMDPQMRSTSSELLVHPFVIKDDFPSRFLPELRQRILEEFQCNPLLRKHHSTTLLNSAWKKSRESSEKDSERRKLSVRRGSFAEPPRWKISLSSENGSRDERRPSVDANRSLSTRRKLSDALEEEEEVEIEEEESENRMFSSSGRFEPTAREVMVDVQPPSPEPFRSLQSFPQSVQTPGRTNEYTNASLRSNHQAVRNSSSFGDTTKRSPLPSRGARDPSYLSKALQSGLGSNALPFPPKTQLIRRLDRPPGGIYVDPSVLGNLGEPATPPSWHCRRNPTRGVLQRRSNKSDFSLPDVPGATGSPMKGSKKKLATISLNPADVYLSPRFNASRPPSETSRSRLGSNFPFV